MTVYSVGTPVNTHSATGSVTGTWGSQQFRVAGHLLVAVVTCGASTSVTATATVSGWSNRFEQPNSGTANVRVAIWTKTATGSDAAPVFTSTETGTAGGMDCMLFELSGANTTTPVDKSAAYASGASPLTLSGSTMTATTAALAANGECAISVFAQNAAAGVLTFTDTGTGGFSKLLNGNGANSVLQTYVGIANPAGSATLNDSGAFSTNTSAFGAALVVAFAATVPAPAVNVTFANNAAGTVTAGGTTAPAGGTSESWTVTATGAFPVATALAQPPTQFTVCDPAVPTEKMLVTVAPGGTGAGQSWTVTRGAEGTTPLTHLANFAVVDVTTAGFLTGVSKELSAVAYVDCDYTGAVDASAAFNAALASLPVISGFPHGKIVFGPGSVKIAVTPDNPGPCVYIEGAGLWATFIYSYVPAGGDCFRVFDPSVAAAVDNTVNGGGISGITVLGNNAGAGSCGLHIGDVTNYQVNAVVLNFTGAGSKGVWFDNEYHWTEMLNGDLYVSGCTQCVVFDNPTAAANTSSSSFARCRMVIRLGQGLDGTGQVWGDGVVLQNGALLTNSDLSIFGNFSKSAAVTSAAVLRIIGATPAGHSFITNAGITFSRLHIGVELDAVGANANAPMTVFSDGTGRITGCYGILDFGQSQAFAASNIANQLIGCNFTVHGDTALGANFAVADYEQFVALTAAYTLTTATTAQKLFNATANGAVTVRAGTSYFMEAEFDITGLSGSAHTISFGLGGTATYTSVKYWAHRIDTSTALSTAGAWTDQVITSSAATALTAAGVTTTIFAARLSGIIRVNATGTLIPQITNATNGIAAVVGTNSWFRLTPVGGDSTSSAGDWS